MSSEDEAPSTSKLTEKSSSLRTLFRTKAFEDNVTSDSDLDDASTVTGGSDTRVDTFTAAKDLRENSDLVLCDAVAGSYGVGDAVAKGLSSSSPAAVCETSDDGVRSHCETPTDLPPLDMAMKILNQCEGDTGTDSDSDTYYESVTTVDELETGDGKAPGPSTRNTQGVQSIEKSYDVVYEDSIGAHYDEVHVDNIGANYDEVYVDSIGEDYEEVYEDSAFAGPSLVSQTAFSNSEFEYEYVLTGPNSVHEYEYVSPSVFEKRKDAGSWDSAGETAADWEYDEPNDESSSEEYVYGYEYVDQENIKSNKAEHGGESWASAGFTGEAVPSEHSLSAHVRDAWIPSRKTMAVLKTCTTQQKAPLLTKIYTTRPALSSELKLGDPVQSLVTRLKGSVDRENVAPHVGDQEEVQIGEIMESGNYRRAANTCAELLTNHGQGFDQAAVAKNTPQTLWFWFERIYSLMKLKLYDMAAAEMAPFKNLDNPDMYYEFYPQEYPGHSGSMVPFELRRLHADLPRHMGKPLESLIRHHKLLAICSRILKNLSHGKTETGLKAVLEKAYIMQSLEYWMQRRIEVISGIGNTLIQMEDYDSAIRVYDDIIKYVPGSVVDLQSGIGRLHVYLGNIAAAKKRFKKVERAAEDLPAHRVQIMLNNGLLHFATNESEKAFSEFQSALDLDPTNLLARNNEAICLLLRSRMREAIDVLENDRALMAAIQAHGEQVGNINRHHVLTEVLLYNLLTMYESGPSDSSWKKKNLFLQYVAPKCGDSLDISHFETI